MFDPATYKPDRLVVDGSAWMRNTLGLKNHQFSHTRVGGHVHMLNCMFDMVTLCAVVEPHPSGYSTVTKTGTCHVCTPPKPVEAASVDEAPWDGLADWSDHPDHAKHVLADRTTRLGKIAMSTAARDNLTAFYAANPDVESADGATFLALPDALKDEHDALLRAATAERAARVRIEYDTARGHFVRNVAASALGKSLGRVLRHALDRSIAWNLAVYNASGVEVTFDFACFR